MESNINAWIQWSLKELKELVEDKDSCVNFERAKRHIALQPFHLNNLNKALHEILSTSIYNYDPELKGLLLSYKNPKLLSSLGSILYDSYYIHVDIEADFYVFRPEIGCTLNGIVNKQATNHIGVLVHKAFHVSIPINEDDEAWQGHDVYVGQHVKFTVTHLDFKGKLPFIRGKLLSESTLTPDDNEDPQLESITSKHSDDIVNGDEMEDSDDTISRKHTASKPSKRINFLTSLLNQSSESSSEEEMKPVKKLRERKMIKKSIENMKECKKKETCALQHDDDISSPTEDKYSSKELENGQDVSNQKVKKKSKSRKKVESISKDGNVDVDKDDTLIVKKRTKTEGNEVTDDVPPAPVANHDRKPRIIHDHVLNGKEHNIKIERKPLQTSKKRSIFAHDISDSDDDTDNDRKPLTQFTYSRISEINLENGSGKNSNGLKNSDTVTTDDETEGQSGMFKRMANKTDEKQIGLSDDNVDTKEHPKHNINITTSTPVRICKLKENSPKSKVIQQTLDNHLDVKYIDKDNQSDTSADDSSIENERKMKKKLKKKLQKLTPEKTSDTSIKYSSPSRTTNIKNETAASSPQKSPKNRRKCSDSENDLVDFKSPRKMKIRKNETNLFANVKIKREPDASDIESSSSNKIDRKLKNDTMNESESFVEVRVKNEPVNVKPEKKRKLKKESKNGTKVKHESDTSDSDTSFLPRKKIKTIFSE